MAAILLAIATSHVYAAEGFYVGANLAQVQVVTEGGPPDFTFKPTAISIKVGKEISPNFAVEARVGTGLSSDTVTFTGVRDELEVDRLVGAYVKGILPLGTISPYLLAGYTSEKLTSSVSAFGFSASDTDSGFSYGIGVDFDVSKTVFLTAEWAHLLKSDGFKVQGLSIGAAIRF